MRDYGALYGTANELALYGSTDEEAGYGYVADQLNDLRRAALYAQGVPLGHNNDMVLTWLQINGATGVNDLNDAWRAMLDAQLAENLRTGHVNDDWYTLLGTLGFTGTINEREWKFWYGGGTFGDVAPVWQAIPVFTFYEAQGTFTLNLKDYSYARPDVTGWGTSLGSVEDPPTVPDGVLTITWAQVVTAGGAGQYAVTVSATNPEGGPINTVFTLLTFAGEQEVAPYQSKPVEYIYSIYGDPPGAGLDMTEYFTSNTTPPYLPSGAWSVSASAVAQIDADTGLLTRKTEQPNIGKYQLQVTARNSVGDGSTDWFDWEVLPPAGWFTDFTKASVFPALNGLTLTRDGTQTFNDYRATPAAAANNVPALIGQELVGGNAYTERDVGYGLAIRSEEPINSLYGYFSDLDEFPSGGMAREMCIQIVFRVTYIPQANEFLRLMSIVTSSKDTADQVAILTGTGPATFALNTRVDVANSIDAQTVPINGQDGRPLLKIGDVVDMRARVSEVEGALRGLRLWVDINNTDTVTAADPNVLQLPQSEPLDLLALGGGDTDAYPMELIHARMVPTGNLTDDQIAEWGTWEQPVPIHQGTNPDYLNFGAGNPGGPVVQLNSQNVSLVDVNGRGGAAAVFTVGADVIANVVWEAETAYGSEVWNPVDGNTFGDVTGQNSNTMTVQPTAVTDSCRVRAKVDGAVQGVAYLCVSRAAYYSSALDEAAQAPSDFQTIAGLNFYLTSEIHFNFIINSATDERDTSLSAAAKAWTAEVPEGTGSTMNIPAEPSSIEYNFKGMLCHFMYGFRAGVTASDPRRYQRDYPAAYDMADGMTILMIEQRDDYTGGTSFAVQDEAGAANLAAVKRGSNNNYAIVMDGSTEQDTGIHLESDEPHIICLSFDNASGVADFWEMGVKGLSGEVLEYRGGDTFLGEGSPIQKFSGAAPVRGDAAGGISVMNDKLVADSFVGRMGTFAVYHRVLNDVEKEMAMRWCLWQTWYGQYHNDVFTGVTFNKP